MSDQITFKRWWSYVSWEFHRLCAKLLEPWFVSRHYHDTMVMVLKGDLEREKLGRAASDHIIEDMDAAMKEMLGDKPPERKVH